MPGRAWSRRRRARRPPRRSARATSSSEALVSSTVSCSSAAHSVSVSSRMPAQIFATPTGWTMKSSPDLRRWSAWCSQANTNAVARRARGRPAARPRRRAPRRSRTGRESRRCAVGVRSAVGSSAPPAGPSHGRGVPTRRRAAPAPSRRRRARSAQAARAIDARSAIARRSSAELEQRTVRRASARARCAARRRARCPRRRSRRRRRARARPARAAARPARAPAMRRPGAAQRPARRPPPASARRARKSVGQVGSQTLLDRRVHAQRESYFRLSPGRGAASRAPGAASSCDAAARRRRVERDDVLELAGERRGALERVPRAEREAARSARKTAAARLLAGRRDEHAARPRRRARRSSRAIPRPRRSHELAARAARPRRRRPRRARRRAVRSAPRPRARASAASTSSCGRPANVDRRRCRRERACAGRAAAPPAVPAVDLEREGDVDAASRPSGRRARAERDRAGARAAGRATREAQVLALPHRARVAQARAGHEQRDRAGCPSRTARSALELLGELERRARHPATTRRRARLWTGPPAQSRAPRGPRRRRGKPRRAPRSTRAGGRAVPAVSARGARAHASSPASRSNAGMLRPEPRAARRRRARRGRPGGDGARRAARRRSRSRPGASPRRRARSAGALAELGDLRLGLEQRARLDVAALGVERVELARRSRRRARRRGQQQLDAGVGALQAARGVDPRREPEADASARRSRGGST